MEAALTSKLLGNASLAALVGGRVHWDALPRSVSKRPFVILQLVSGGDDYHMRGVSALRNWQVQIDAWGETADQAKAVSGAVRTALSGFSGTVNDVVFDGVFLVRERGGKGTAADGNDLSRRSMDFDFHWKKEG
jgi:hypothetical protein